MPKKTALEQSLYFFWKSKGSRETKEAFLAWFSHAMYVVK